MAARLIALGVNTPNIDPVGAAQEARTLAINQRGANLAQEAQAFEQVAQMGLGVMGGKLDGEVDPTRLSQMVTLLGDNPIAQKLKEHPELLPVITRGSVNVLKAANDAEQFELEKQKLGLEIQKAHDDLAKGKLIEVSPNATLHDITGATPDYTAPGAAPQPTDDQRELSQINAERKAAGKPELSMEDYLAAKGGGNGVTITNPDGTVTQIGGKASNAYDVADAKRLVELSGKIADEGRAGTNSLATLSKMRTLLGSDQVYTGIGADQVQSLKRAAVALGFADADSVKDTESFNALGNKAVLDAAGGSLGTGFSNADREYLSGTAPTLANTKEGNLQLIDVLSKIAQRKVDIAKFAADYKKAHNNRLDGNFDGELAAWADAHPVFGDVGSGNVPDDADETKVVDGKTYYRKGADWFEAD